MAKKNKHQKPPAEESDSATDSKGKAQNESGKGCVHVIKAVNLAAVKKILKSNFTFGECQTCKKLSVESQSTDAENVIEDTTWFCLQCGNQGCGSNVSRHAFDHFMTPHSDCHSIALETASWNIWCHDCKADIAAKNFRKLTEAIDFIRKHTKSRKSNIQPLDAVEASSSTDKKVVIEKGCESLKKDKVTNKKADSNAVCRVKGFSNLGNTCFFNAVLQNLTQTSILATLNESHFKNGSIWSVSQEDEVINVALPECGKITESLMKFLKEVHTSKSKVLNPGNLFGKICQRYSEFRGNQQQDSHELLRILLDAVRNEEISRQKEGILHMFKLSKKSNPESVDPDTKTKIKALGTQASYTVVERVYGGQLLNTILCEVCNTEKQIFELFLDLSLPVAEEKPIRPGLQKKNNSDDQLKGFDEEKKPNKQQLRKMKRQSKKEAKKKAKVFKPGSHLLPAADEKESEAEADPEDAELSLVSMFQEDEEKTNLDADVEDNEDSETISSRNSTASAKSINDFEMGENGDSVANMQCAMTEKSAEILDETCDNAIRTKSVLTCEPVSLKDLDETPLEDNLNEQFSRLSMNVEHETNMTPDSLSLPLVCSTDSGINHIENVTTTCHSPIVNDDKNKEHSPTDSGISFGEAGESVKLNDKSSKKNNVTWVTKSLTTLAPRYQPTSQECSIMSCLNQFTAPELLTGNNKIGCQNCTKLKAQKEGTSTDRTVCSNASKQMLIFSPPAILTLHLKRFQQCGVSLRKVNTFVEFPLILDIASFCTSAMTLLNGAKHENKVLYSLYGIVEHSGRLTGGHYTAFVKGKSQSSQIDFLNKYFYKESDIEKLKSQFQNMELNETVKSEGTEEDQSSGSESDSQWYYISDGQVNEVSVATVLKSQAYLLFYERIR